MWNIMSILWYVLCFIYILGQNEFVCKVSRFEFEEITLMDEIS